MDDQQRAHADVGFPTHLLEAAVRLGNELVWFDAHSVYLQADASEADAGVIVWSAADKIQGVSAVCSDEGVDSFRRAFEQIRDSGSGFLLKDSEMDGNANLLSILINASRSRGILSVQRLDKQAFGDTDIRLLQYVCQLLAEAIDSNEAADRLMLLDLELIDRRAKLAASNVEDILTDYLRKAIDLFHPSLRWASEFYPVPFEHVRADAKLKSRNDKALRFAAHVSNSDFEERVQDWTAERLDRVYFLNEKESIASRVVADRHYWWTNSYNSQTNVIRLFDSVCHITAPIVLNGQILGVLTIETDIDSSYSETKAAMFAIIAAHCARPVQIAILREESERRAREHRTIRTGLANLSSCHDEASILTCLKNTMQELGYRRGVISRVDYLNSLVIGEDSWGDDRMEEVRKLTRRNFSNQKDCQVKAIFTREVIPVDNPQKDDQASPDSLNIGGLRSFAVCPLLDGRGRAIMTFHIERDDAAPLGSDEIAALRQLFAHAMALREEILRSRLERKMSDNCIQGKYRRVEQLLADVICWLHSEGLASRCRVYSVLPSGRQVGLMQSGIEQVDDFCSFQMDEAILESDSVVRNIYEELSQSGSPILVRRRNVNGGVPGSVDAKLLLVDSVPFESRLKKQSINEWIEIPIRFSRRTVFKVVIDHKSTPEPLSTVDDLRFWAGFSRSLSLAVQKIQTDRSRTQLILLGLHQGWLHHFFLRAADELLYDNGSRSDNRLEVAERMREMFKKVNGLFPLASVVPEAVTVEEEIRTSAEFFKMSTGVELERIGDAIGGSVPSSYRPLFQLILLLASNSHRHSGLFETHKKPMDQLKDARSRSIRLVTRCSNETGSDISLEIQDNGVGVQENVDELNERIEHPESFLSVPHQGGVGLAYASLLCGELGWKLEIGSACNPTSFRITLKAETPS